MNIWDHSRLSVRKFGGIEEDYFQIHKFIDSSKLFYCHFKHRLLLHNLYGVAVTIDKFGDVIQNADKAVVLVRDIAIEHIKEDLNGYVPSLNDWLEDNDEELSKLVTSVNIKDEELKAFVFKPLIMSNLKSSLLITTSDFGLYLCQELLGLEKALILQKQIAKNSTVKRYLEQFRVTKRWQFTPDPKEIKWLKTNKNEYRRSIKRGNI